MKAAPLLISGLPIPRLCLQHNPVADGFLTRRPWTTAALTEDNVSAAGNTTAVLRVKDPPKHRSWDDPDYRKWKDKEEEIFKDIDRVVSLTKRILHSDRYMDGDLLTEEDEKVVVQKLLAYHPRRKEKIGCGLDSIMVDRHPQFGQSRCLFVVRTDGGWIDFSYQKCLRSYIRNKYPSYAEKFIREHLKRGSG